MITFITGNPAKAEQVQRHVNFPMKHIKLNLDEVQSLDPIYIVKTKAKSAYEIIKAPVLVEDVSLTFHSIGKLPGPLIKWFLEELQNEGLCRLLDGYKDRSATASVYFNYYDGNEHKIFSASKEGIITNHPRGDNSFGWDPIFVPEGCEETWGEMNEEMQNETSMRKIALAELANYLRTK